MIELVIAAVAVLAAQRTTTRLFDQVHDKVLDEASSRLVSAIVGSQQDQLALLRSIDRKLDALVQGDYRAGMVYLEDAALPHRTPEQRADALVKARDAFFHALGTEAGDNARTALIRLQLGYTYVAMDAWLDAERMFDRAAIDALRAGLDCVRRGAFGVGSAVPVYPLTQQVLEARVALGADRFAVPSFRPSQDFSIAFEMVVPYQEASPLYLLFPMSGPDWQAARRMLLWMPTDTLALIGSRSVTQGDLQQLEVGKALKDVSIPTVDEVRQTHVCEAARVIVAERRRNWPPRHLTPVGQT